MTKKDKSRGKLAKAVRIDLNKALDELHVCIRSVCKIIDAPKSEGIKKIPIK